MASYRGHLAFSCSLGFVYGGIGHNLLGFDIATSLLGSGVTAIGGLLPDLDSDSGVPIREMFSLTAAIVPVMLIKRLSATSLTEEEILVTLGLIYAIIRWGLSRVVKRWTVHRGMFHSVPAMLIAGGLMFLAYHHPNVMVRWYLAGGVMVGFLSHLLLDELYSVDFRGLQIRLNKYAGSAFKFTSKSWIATSTCYVLLAIVGYGVMKEAQPHTHDDDIPPAIRVEWPQPDLSTSPKSSSPLQIMLGDPTMRGAGNMRSPTPMPGSEESEFRLPK